MKRFAAFILAAVMCIALTGCTQKSQEVKNTEVMIKAIGTVTQESGEDIVTAEKFYSKLTDEEKGQVSNYDTLQKARAAYDEMIMYGQWVKYATDRTSKLTLNQDGSFTMSDGTAGTFEKSDTQVVLTAADGTSITLEKDVHMNLVHLVADDDTDYIRPELLTVESDNITTQSWDRVFNIPHHVHIEKDDFGLAEDYWNSYIVMPKDEYKGFIADGTDFSVTIEYTTRNVATVHNPLNDNLVISDELTEPVQQTATVQFTADSFADTDSCCTPRAELVRGNAGRHENYKYVIKQLEYLENGLIVSVEGKVCYYDQLVDYYRG